jgi:hypothetical protein
MSDLDFLVPQSLVSAVRTLLTQQGYSLPVELADGFQEDFSDVQVYTRSGAASVIEVHWNLFHSSYYHKRVPIQWFWQQTTEFRMNDRVAQTFSPEAQLLYLAGHMLLQGHGESLLWLYDVALLFTRYREQMAWSEVIEAARLFELGQVLRTVLAHVSEIWGVAVPIDVQERLNELPLGVNERMAFAITTARHLDAKVVWNGLNMPDLRSKFAYLAQVIFPSSAYMQTRYRIRDLHLLPLYYVGRVGKGLSKFIRSAFSIAANTIRVFRFPQNG